MSRRIKVFTIAAAIAGVVVSFLIYRGHADDFAARHQEQKLLRDRISAAESSAAEAGHRLAEAADRSAVLQGEIAAAREICEEATGTAQSNEEAIVDLHADHTARRQEFNTRHSENEERLARAVAALESLGVEIASGRQDLAALGERIADAQRQLESALADKAEAERALGREQTRLAELQSTAEEQIATLLPEAQRRLAAAEKDAAQLVPKERTADALTRVLSASAVPNTNGIFRRIQLTDAERRGRNRAIASRTKTLTDAGIDERLAKRIAAWSVDNWQPPPLDLTGPRGPLGEPPMFRRIR